MKKTKTPDAQRTVDLDMAALCKRFAEHQEACELIQQLAHCPAVKTMRVTLREWATPPKLAAFTLDKPSEISGTRGARQRPRP